MKRLIVTLAVMLAVVGSAGTASAHGLKVQPADEPVVDQAVSTAWAQAHCQAAAPEKATASSGGVVTFVPDTALPCPDPPGEGTPGR